ncbi:hypothetical protein [Mesorhizobium sp.]|nr:hypothetical protein [Mesorhizobium sp.]
MPILGVGAKALAAAGIAALPLEIVSAGSVGCGSATATAVALPPW